ALHTRSRSRSALGSSKPDENQWRDFHACLRVVSRSRSQRHSVRLFSVGMIATKRNGRSRFNGNSFNATATSLVEDFPANFLTTWPRLVIEQTGRRWILCQLMSARQTRRRSQFWDVAAGLPARAAG